MQLMSKALGRHITYTVLLPDGKDVGPGPYPVLYQLHGASDDHSAWLNLSNLVRHVRDMPLIVVLPDGALSWWSNLNRRTRYEDFVMEDLANHVQQTFHVREGKAAIGGLSMGGFGAIRLGLKYPDRFCSIWAHSSAIRTAEDLQQWIDQGYFPPDTDVHDLDCYALVKKLDRLTMPRLSFDCGTEDFLIEHNRHFHAFLEEHKVPHTYNEHPGAHTWDYWDTHVQEALNQHAQELGIAPAD
jgi:S-formylglutathione hydrolase FrmB